MIKIPFTKEGLESIQKEYDSLLSERPDAVMHLKKARELGDLSENGYYKASRSKLSFIDSRLRHFKYLIKNSILIEKSVSDKIQLGMTINVHDGKSEKKYLIVGGFESDPSTGKISHVSPLGKALLGAKVGESVLVKSPNGEKKYKVISIDNNS